MLNLWLFLLLLFFVKNRKEEIMNRKNVISVIKNCIFASERFYHDFIALLLQNNNIKMNL